MNDYLAVPIPISRDEWEEASRIYHRYHLPPVLAMQHIGADADAVGDCADAYDDGGLAAMVSDTLRRLRKAINDE